jgi:4'-phosphopantetheinyl transferase
MNATAPQEMGSTRLALREPELWCVDVTAAAPALLEIERRTPRLSDWDRQTAAAMADAVAAEQWLATHAALRLLIERRIGRSWRAVPLERKLNARPRLADAPVSFSLSHIPGMALIALTPQGDIGVDLERTRSVRVRQPRREAIEAAGAALNSCALLPEDADARFLQAWVRLEAFAKADGCGIGRLLTRFGIVGARGVAPAQMAENVRLVRAKGSASAVSDIDLGTGRYAAIALAPLPAAPRPNWLPGCIDGLEDLLDG